jgi:hypothetical protein
MDIERVLPQTGVKIRLETGCDADLDHFGELVLAVWNRIDDSDRRRIADHWSKMAVRPPMIGLLASSWFEDPNAFARTKHFGRTVAFDWPSCRLMPDDILESLIAHELAHVYQWAIGKFSTLTENDIDWNARGHFKHLVKQWIGDEGRVELHADQTMSRWGFDPLDVHAWLFQFARIENGVVTVPPNPLKSRKHARKRAGEDRCRTYASCSPFVRPPATSAT